jgi:peptide/nickel transport system substrate-binding protein
MMRRKTIGLVAGLALLAMPAAAQQQSLNVAVGGAFTSMDPHFFNLGPNNVLTSYVFEPLTRFDPKYSPEPSLAVPWKELRDGVKFTDGTPFTADDVVFNFARIGSVTARAGAAGSARWRFLGSPLDGTTG